MDALDLKEVDHVQTSAPEGVVRDDTAKAGFRVFPPCGAGPDGNPAFAVRSCTRPTGAEVWTWHTPFRSNASIHCFATPKRLLFVGLGQLLHLRQRRFAIGGPDRNTAFAVPSRTRPSGAEVWTWCTPFRSNASIPPFTGPGKLPWFAPGRHSCPAIPPPAWDPPATRRAERSL